MKWKLRYVYTCSAAKCTVLCSVIWRVGKKILRYSEYSNGYRSMPHPYTIWYCLVPKNSIAMNVRTFVEFVWCAWPSKASTSLRNFNSSPTRSRSSSQVLSKWVIALSLHTRHQLALTKVATVDIFGNPNLEFCNPMILQSSKASKLTLASWYRPALMAPLLKNINILPRRAKQFKIVWKSFWNGWIFKVKRSLHYN